MQLKTKYLARMVSVHSGLASKIKKKNSIFILRETWLVKIQGEEIATLNLF
jgi:hypothetical protein